MSETSSPRCESFDAESRQSRLVETAITPNRDHFVRNHGGVPEIDEDAYELELDGLVNTPMKITLADLKNEKLFKRQSNVVSIQCSGTRRIEQIREYPGDGLSPQLLKIQMASAY